MPRHKKSHSPEKRQAPQPISQGPWSWKYVGLAVVLAAVVVIYWPASYGAQLWDDDANITRPELQSAHGLSRIWFEPGATQQYYPLLHTAFWIEHRLWADSPRGYHLVNIVWHMISVVLLYAVLCRLKISGALLAAAIFAVHPVMVESVAWITEQKNTLSMMFYLGSVLAYLRFGESRRRSTYLIAVGLFVLALLSKTATVTLPAALLVILWWQRGTLQWRRDFLPTLPFFIAAALAGLMTCFVEWNHVGAVGAPFEFDFLERLLLAGRAIWFYLSKLLWPVNLIFIYPRWKPDTSQWWQWLFPIGVVVLTVALWAIRKRTRAPLAGWLFFCGTLLPMLPFLNQFLFLYTFVSDHFQYMAGLGIIVLVAAAITIGLNRLPASAAWLRVALPLMLLVTLASLSRQQTKLYADNVALYSETLARNPTCWFAHNNLGYIAQQSGDYQAAIAHYQESLKLNPKSAKAYNNLGQALTDVGRLKGAFAALHSALDLTPNDPVILNSLAAAHIHAGQFTEAQQYLERALTLDPNYAGAHQNMGIALGVNGQIPQAIEQFNEAATLDPNDANIQNNWARLLASSGNHQGAAVHYRQAVTLSPGRADIQTNLAEALRLTGKLPEAIERFTIALRLQPDYAPTHAGLAQALDQSGRYDEAVATARKSVELARASGQSAVANYMENWLKQYHAAAPPAGNAPKSQ
jgi:tetratricopeptide (TPR) repeat protein